MNGEDNEILKKLYQMATPSTDWYAENYQKQSALFDTKKPASYQSDYAKTSEKLLDEYLNRGSFDYNPSRDSSYTAYESKMKKEGEKAMRDSVAKATELTGGYGSSYAQSAGMQAYNSYLEKIADAVSDYEDKAYSRYKDESDSYEDKIKLLSSLDSDAYDKYRDTVSDYYKDREYLNSKYEYANDTFNSSKKSVISLLEKLASMENSDYYKWLNASK